jgi:phosphatidylglycerol:prolipoprotein diacylglycerol transferase
MLAVGFACATALVLRQARGENVASGKILDLALVILITGIIGSRGLYVLLHWRDFSDDLISIVLLNRGGLAIYGGFAFSIPLGMWFMKKQGLPFWRTADLVVPYVALAQSFGRIGCFLNGCCYGRPTMSIAGMYIPPHALPIHPAQLYASLGLLALFVILRHSYRRRRFDGQIFLSYILLYCALRFFMEMARGDTAIAFVGLTFFQCMSVLLFGIGLFIYGARLCKTTHLS